MAYVDKEALLAEYDREHQGPPGKARKLIENAPAADVAPARHGRWREGVYAGYKCSECRTTWDAPTKFCPNCGADMREVQSVD